MADLDPQVQICIIDIAWEIVNAHKENDSTMGSVSFWVGI